MCQDEAQSQSRLLENTRDHIDRRDTRSQVGPPEDPRLKPADGSQMGISAMAVFLMGVVDLFCGNTFGGTAVDLGFERGLVVDYATGWDMDDKEQMEEVERHVRGEEPR